MPTPFIRPCLALVLVLLARPVLALEVCDLPPRYGLGETAIRIARAACDEHRQWYRPFIGLDGRLANLRVTEAERSDLLDHGVEAWRRVATYWQESGTLAMLGAEGSQNCLTTGDNRLAQAECRAFIVDNPWSAAFVSWVMVRAGVPGFRPSPRHIDYIRAAYSSRPGSNAFAFTDPASGKPASGDLLCFLRGNRKAFGYAGLRDALASNRYLPPRAHCDIVVAANVGGDRTLYLIGGNVLNAVTMRKLPLDRLGHVTPPMLPTSEDDAEDSGSAGDGCSPGNEAGCDFNRQDWVVLLKLQDGGVPAPIEAIPGETVPAAVTAPVSHPPGPPR